MSHEPFRIELPFPPSVNHYWRRVGNKTLISERGRTFRKDVCTLVLASGLRTPFAEGVSLRMEVIAPDRRRRDLDNLLKAPLDALQHAGVYHDDTQIEELSVCRRGILAPGSVVVTVCEIRTNCAIKEHKT